MSDIFGAVGDLFGGVSSFLSGNAQAKGYGAAAAGFKSAAALAQENAAVTERSTAIQEAQAARNIYRTISGTQAALAGAGLSGGGSGQYLLRSGAEQGGVTTGLIANQGLITKQGFLAEEQADIGQEQQTEAMQKAAKRGGIGGLIGGIAGAIGSIFSDARLKRDVVLLATLPAGYGIYRFRYRGSDKEHIGVIAQEVQKIYPEAVSEDGGFLKVNYAVLGLEGLVRA